MLFVVALASKFKYDQVFMTLCIFKALLLRFCRCMDGKSPSSVLSRGPDMSGHAPSHRAYTTWTFILSSECYYSEVILSSRKQGAMHPHGSCRHCEVCSFKYSWASYALALAWFLELSEFWQGARSGRCSWDSPHELWKLHCADRCTGCIVFCFFLTII